MDSIWVSLRNKHCRYNSCRSLDLITALLIPFAVLFSVSPYVMLYILARSPKNWRIGTDSVSSFIFPMTFLFCDIIQRMVLWITAKIEAVFVLRHVLVDVYGGDAVAQGICVRK